MKTTSMHEEHGAAESSEHEVAELMRQEEKQGLHEKWWILSVFAAIVPFGLTFSSSLRPLFESMKADTLWVPPIDEHDIGLLDGALLLPSLFVPVFMGMLLDSSWSVNLGLLVCLSGSVLGHLFVALGIAWHSFGLALLGRVISGMCCGSILVVADTIGAQFNRKRRATTFGLIGSIQSVGFALNMFLFSGFVERSLDANYEKGNDVLMIVGLLCLGIGFLWSPITSSFHLRDTTKRRFWKWHVPLSVWALLLAEVFSVVYHAGPSTTNNTYVYELGTIILLGPLLGYYLDVTTKSQDGCKSPSRWLIGVTTVVLVGNVMNRMSPGTNIGGIVAAVGAGLVNMLVRCVVPQIASRDNLSTSFGLIESGMFVGIMVLSSALQLTYLVEMIYLVANIVIFGYIMLKVGEKWRPRTHEHVESGIGGELTEPLHGRGG